MRAAARRARELVARARRLEASGVAPEEAERTLFAEADSSADVTLYETFIARRAPERRRQHGVYFTPEPLVAWQVSRVSELLQRIGLAQGLGDSRILIVDPATGSGAYPRAIVQRAPDAAGRMLLFETLPGAAATARAAGLPIREEDALDIDVLPEAPVVVCIGNPPYRRHRADPRRRILLDSLGAPSDGVHAKNLHNEYVYFWAWALDRVLDRRDGAAVVSFVTAASYLRGPAFGGLREAMRRHFDEIWIVDLEGDSLAARRTANVFRIRTPVAIAMGVRHGPHQPEVAARGAYVRPGGAPAHKLEALGRLELASSDWRPIQRDWQAPLLPLANAAYNRWPRLTDLFPWQVSGVQLKRTWPIAPTPDILRERWMALLSRAPGAERAQAFVTTRDRAVDATPPDLLGQAGRLEPLNGLPADAASPAPARYAYRSFDRQWLLADPRMGDFIRPSLWRISGPRQVFLTSLLTNVLGPGPAAVATALVPDLDCFRGSFGARAVIPLWRDAAGTWPNVADGVLERLSDAYGVRVCPETLMAYCYALLATRGYVRRFEEELCEPGPRIPFTRERGTFCRAVDLGQRLIALHTFRGVPRGLASALRPLGTALPGGFAFEDGQLHIGDGVIGPVNEEVWRYSVSGLPVVKSWLRRRLQPRRGRSPLDAIGLSAWSQTLTDELLEVVWVLEETLRMEPELDAILASCSDGAAWPTAEGVSS